MSNNSDFKILFKYKNKPILKYVLDYWKEFSDNFIFVVGNHKEEVCNFLTTEKGIKYKIVIQEEQKGIADAIMKVKEFVNDSFFVILGDCICSGTFQKMPLDTDVAIGVFPTDNPEDIFRSYSVEIGKNGYVQFVKEKPSELINNLCGMGYYYFDVSIFSYISNTQKNKRTQQIEITDVIQNIINDNKKVLPVLFSGHYVNLTYISDISKLSFL